MFDKKRLAAAGIGIGAAISTLILFQKSNEALVLMHKAAEEFLRDFPWHYNGLHGDPSASALMQAQEPYRTHSIVFLCSAIASGVASISCFVYIARDYIMKVLRAR